MYSADHAEIVGIQLGDGCLSRNQRYAEMYIGGDMHEEREYHDTWVKPLYEQTILIPVFGLYMKYVIRDSLGIYGCHLFYEEVVQYFEAMGICVGPKLHASIPAWILARPKYAKRCLRGLFDTDGSVYFAKNYSAKYPMYNYARIQLALTSKTIIDQVEQLLKLFGLSPMRIKAYIGTNGKEPTHRIVVHRKADILWFRKHIGFKNSKHVTKFTYFDLYGCCPAHMTVQQRQEQLR